MRVEAAAFQGRPVWFTIVNPWDRPTRQEQAEESPGEGMIQAFFVTIFFVILLGAALLARHNLRRGLGDRKGAFRLAAFAFTLEMVSWLFAAHHVSDVGGEFTLFIESLAWALMLACLLWLVYVALEPFVRRRWPGRIISWNRLLAGGLGDPLVGRDVLLGALFGFCAVALNYLQTLAPQWLGMPATTPQAAHPDAFAGAQYTIPLLCRQATSALIFPAALMFLLLLFSILLRREWAAIALIFVLLTLLGTWQGEHHSIDWMFALADATLTLFILLRFGLLAMVFTEFFQLTFYFFPVTTDFSAWYAGSAAFALAVCLALILYGFRTSLAGQPLFRTSLVGD